MPEGAVPENLPPTANTTRPTHSWGAPSRTRPLATRPPRLPQRTPQRLGQAGGCVGTHRGGLRSTGPRSKPSAARRREPGLAGPA